MSNWLRVLGLMFGAATAGAVIAADVGVRGRIVDSRGRIGFEGAIVTIEPVGLETVSARDGTFRIDAVPAGEYVLRVDYVGAPTLRRDIQMRSRFLDLGDIAIGADVTELGNVLVIGPFANQASAVNRKRTSDTIVDSVSADALGQLPDWNAAEALQRLPGVSVITEQGEGRFVTVRGIDPNLNSVSVGGVRLPSGEDDARQVELDLVPTELLQTLAVQKTQTPDQDADAIGASIEIDTVTAFDRADKSANATVQGSSDETTGTWSPKAWGSATRLFDVGEGTRNFGVAIAGTWAQRTFGWATLENEDGWPVLEGPDGAFRVAENIEQHNQRNDLERSGFVLNLDYHPNGDSEWYLHTLHTNIDDAQTRELNRYRFDEGDVAALSSSSGRFTDARLEKSVMQRREVRQLDSIVTGLSQHWDTWTLDADAAWANTREREPDSMEAVFHTDSDLAYAGSGPIPALAPTSITGSDASAFSLDQILNERVDSRDRETHLRVDLRRDLSLGERQAFLQFGAKARRRDKSNNVDITTFDGFGRDVFLSEFATTNDYPFGAFGPVIDAWPMRGFFAARRNSFHVDPVQTFIDSLSRDFRIEEDVDAAYVMGGIDIGALRLVGGARVEHTDLHAEGTRITIDGDPDGNPTLTPVTNAKNYTDVLPGLHVRYDLSPTWLVRAALTQSLARPSFGFLAPAQRIAVLQGDDGVVRRAEIGNPELNPYRSSNIDLSFEYYGDQSLDAFSADAFFKRIEDPIVLADLAGTGIYTDFDSAIVPVNGDSARVAGVELSYTHGYTSLPAPWDGLLTTMNLTLTNSDMRLRLTDRHLPLPNQSNQVANLVIGYAKGRLDLRIAGNYRSARLIRLDEPEDRNFDVYENDHFSLDFSAKLRIDNHWRVQFDAINLTNQPLYEYYGDRQHLARYELYGRTFQLGVRCDL